VLDAASTVLEAVLARLVAFTGCFGGVGLVLEVSFLHVEIFDSSAVLLRVFLVDVLQLSHLSSVIVFHPQAWFVLLIVLGAVVVSRELPTELVAYEGRPGVPLRVVQL